MGTIEEVIAAPAVKGWWEESGEKIGTATRGAESAEGTPVRFVCFAPLAAENRRGEDQTRDGELNR